LIGLSATRIILGAELLAYRHRLLKRKTGRLVLLLVALLLATVFIGGGAFSLGVTAGQYLPVARDALLAGGFTALSVLMLIVGFPTVIATFFVGRDLLQLVLAPVRVAEIFAARLALAMSANLLISGVLLAAALGVGVGSGAPPVYFLLLPILIVIQVLVVTAFQAVLMSVVLRWVPARLARDVAAGVAGLAGAGFYLAWNLSLRQSFSSRTRPDVSNLDTVIHRIDWLPTTWPGHALSALIAGHLGSAAIWALLTLLFATLLVGAAGVLYERTLLSGLGVFGGGQAVWKRTARGPVPSARRGAGSPTRAIARKDWLAFRRDVRRLTRLLPALLFPIGYTFAFIRPSGGLNGFWSDVFLVAFMSMFMSTALATPSVPSERRGFQLLRMAPLTMWQVIRAKVVLTLPPVLALTTVFSFVVAAVSGGGVAQILELGILVLWLAAGFVAIGVSAGAIDPHFDATDDRRAVGLLGTLAGFAGSIGFGLLSIGGFALFVFGAAAVAGIAGLGPLPATPAAGALMWAVGLILCAGALTVVAVLLWIANSRLCSYEEAISAT
jgi:ABC-2 type transport system permease protein